MIDCHTHSRFSHDGRENIQDMIEKAISLNMEYLAITDHCDKDCMFVEQYRTTIRQIDLENYFKTLNELKDTYKDKIQIGVGIECGFMSQATSLYEQILSTYPTDIVINSVHLVDFIDCYFKEYFEKKEKLVAYSQYLASIRKSLDVPYVYDTVAHIGYVSRKAPYLDKSFNYSDFSDQIDDILKTIILKNKALEINTHAENTGDFTLPNIEILKRYKALGGELLTFGSDAHKVERIGDLYKETTSRLKDLGFKYLFKYLNHSPIACKI